MARRRLEGLERVLGVNALFSTAYAEATATYPEAGGSSLFARQAFNEFWSFFTAWAQMLNYAITIAISAFFAAHYAGGVSWDHFSTSPGDIVFGIALISLLALVKVRGVKDAVSVNIVLAVVDFLSQLAIVVAGAFLVFSPDVLAQNMSYLGEAPTWRDFLIAIPLGDEGGGCTTLLGVAKVDGGYASDPILGIVKNMDLGALQGVSQVYVAILAVTILVAATNAGVLGVSRLVYSMGTHRQMPDSPRRLHPRYRTPYMGILVFSALACVALLPGQADFLGLIYAFGAMLSFTMAHLALIRLRIKEPDVERPYRSPGRLRVRGRDVPPLAVLGVAGTMLSFAVISVLNLDVAAAGTGWLALGMLVHVAYRRRQGPDLLSTYKVAIPQPVVDHEAEYDSVLVPISEGYDEPVMATATKLAARKRRGIHVVSFVTVPHALPIDAPMREAEAAAQSAIEQPRIQGGRSVSGHVERVRPGQAGRRIVEEAIDMRAAAIVLPLPRRIQGASLFGKTLDTVPAERPGRVVIESTPASDGAVQRQVALQRERV